MAKKKDNLKDMSAADLKKQLGVLSENMRVIRFKADGSKSKNVKELASLRKQVARVMTALNSNAQKTAK